MRHGSGYIPTPTHRPGLIPQRRPPSRVGDCGKPVVLWSCCNANTDKRTRGKLVCLIVIATPRVLTPLFRALYQHRTSVRRTMLFLRIMDFMETWGFFFITLVWCVCRAYNLLPSRVPAEPLCCTLFAWGYFCIAFAPPLGVDYRLSARCVLSGYEV